MAHSTPDPTSRPTGRRVPARFLVLLVVVVLLAGLVSVVIWSYGGFAAASDSKPQAPGSAIRNKLFTLTPVEAAARTQESFSGEGAAQVVVRAELTSHESEAEAASTFTDELTEAHLLPVGKQGESAGIEQVRGEATNPIRWVQPGLTETVLLVWDLPEGVEPGDVERVRLGVLDAEEGTGFVDESERWWNVNGKKVGEVDLPVEGE